jgi:hypothetical protein
LKDKDRKGDKLAIESVRERKRERKRVEDRKRTAHLLNRRVIENYSLIYLNSNQLKKETFLH